MPTQTGNQAVPFLSIDAVFSSIGLGLLSLHGGDDFGGEIGSNSHDRSLAPKLRIRKSQSSSHFKEKFVPV